MTNHPNRSGQRYDLAFFGDVLVACIPHGSDMDAAIDAECSKAAIDRQKPEVISGVYLTEEPLDTDEVVYSGHQMGWLIDKSGETFRYAVKR